MKLGAQVTHHPRQINFYFGDLLMSGGDAATIRARDSQNPVATTGCSATILVKPSRGGDANILTAIR